MNAREFLERHEEKELLRFSTAGSVDDGKSTMIGRLLYDSKLIYEDHLDALKHDSLKRGSVENDFDFALLLDGLRAEREQNITIDVAYRYFSTPKRKFIISDTPGHVQYTRNMVTGASNADLAVILIDASKGILPQTKRHSFIMSLLNIQHLVVAVNKMDLVDYSEEVFERIKKDFSTFAAKLEIPDIQFIPMSALYGENVVYPGERMPWYDGKPLLNHLESVYISGKYNLIDFRFPVQMVLRPNSSFRGYSGTVVSGVVRRGQEVMVLGSGLRSRVKSIITYDGEIEEAFPPQAVTITLEDEIDVSRGDMIVHLNNVPHISDTFEAMLVWMNDIPLSMGKEYYIKHTTNTVQGRTTDVRYKVDVNTLHRMGADQLDLNEIGRATITLNRPVMYDVYSRNRATGSFIVIDRTTNLTVGAGMIIDRMSADSIPTRKLSRVSSGPCSSPHESSIPPAERIKRLNQRPVTVWITGLPKSGKSRIAFALEKVLFDMGYFPYVLDEGNMRFMVPEGVDSGTEEESENVNRVAGIARLFNSAGFIAIAAFVSRYERDRLNARDIIGPECFVEVYLDTSLEECGKRDSKDPNAEVRKGDATDFTGISLSYEPPGNPDVVIPTQEKSVEESVNTIVELLKQRRFLL